MFFTLSKILDFFLNPLIWFFALLILSFFLKQASLKKKIRVVAFVMLLFFSNPFILNTFMNMWTLPLTPKSEVQKAKIGVVLGGMLIYDPQNERPHFNQNVDRLLQALPLLKNGTLDHLVISGGSGYLRYQNFSEAAVLLDYLNEIDMDTQNIWIEGKSKNTYENALFTKKLLDEKFDFEEDKDKVLLFTSAIHMKRALACFKNQRSVGKG